jgi:hypothetical protein
VLRLLADVSIEYMKRTGYVPLILTAYWAFPAAPNRWPFGDRWVDKESD